MESKIKVTSHPRVQVSLAPSIPPTHPRYLPPLRRGTLDADGGRTRPVTPRNASTIVDNDPYNPSAIFQKGGPGASAKKWPEMCSQNAPFAAVTGEARR